MVVQNNTTPYGAANSNLHLLLLKPNDCIRFNLSNCKAFWTRKDALEKVNFFSFAWDMSDNQTSGLVRLSIPSDGSFPTAYSKKVLTVIQLRKGCNGKPGSVALIDRCGVCGGDNSSCRGCDGGFRSGARIGKDFSYSSQSSYDYTIRFISYDSVQTRWFISYRFQIRTIT